MRKLGIAALLLTATLLFCACGAPQNMEEEGENAEEEMQDTPYAEQGDLTAVYVPMWMEEFSIVYYDADLNRTIEKGRDLTEEEIASRGDIDPSMMYGSVLAEPNTKVEYDLHGFLQNVYYLSDDGVSYQLAPPEARG